MISRYDFMDDGVALDPVSGSRYPDPLSLNYLNFRWSQLPKKDKMSESKILFFWKVAEIYYGSAEYDDIVLTLNGVPHKNLLRPGDEVYFPNSKDIIGSFEKDR